MADTLERLYIEPTSKCNLSCSMCFRNTWLNETFGDMDLRVFDKVIETIPEGVQTVFFGGMGEPLYHEDIVLMVQKAAEKHFFAELLTNGTLLTREMSATLLDAGLGKLWVSVDSFENASYGRIRQKSSFAHVLQNISDFNAERAKRGNNVPLGIAFVAMKSNVRQLGRLGRFARENSINEVSVSNLIPLDRATWNESLYSRIVSLELGAENAAYPKINLPQMDCRIEGVAEVYAEMLGLECNLSINGVPLPRKRKYCRFIEDGCAFVRHDGEVSPCMALLHSGTTFLEDFSRTVYHHSFGNAAENGIAAIWDSKEYADFRERVRRFDFSPCINCGGCENRDDNCADCMGNMKPTCGACLWAEGIISCP